jgi:hypothetical protein
MGGTRREKDSLPQEPPAIRYRLWLRFPDGPLDLGGAKSCVRTRRARRIGDLVNLPTGPDGESHPGTGYLWRVTAVRDDGAVLALDYVRSHRAMVEQPPSTD